jgi:hypothetical protein
MKTLRLIPLFAALLATYGRADTWSAAPVQVVVSPDGSALLRVSPGKQDSHASAVVLRYDPQSGGYQKAAEFQLRNPVAPHAVVITNDGKYIVTFDDWGEIGRTENVVVVYRGTGEYLKSWALNDIFTNEERRKFTSSVSSTWWRGEVNLLEDRDQIPIVFIQPDTRMARLDKDRKAGDVVFFVVTKMTFQKK